MSDTDVVPPRSSLFGGSIVVAALAVILGPGAGVAQEIEARSLDLRIGGRLQTQIRQSSVESAPAVEALIRRAWLTVDAELDEWVDGRLQADLNGELRDAYVRFRLDPVFRVSIGKFKRAFDLFELQSSSLINVERDGRVPGLDVCAGVGGICSLSRLTEQLGYSDRDVGLRFDGLLGERFSYLATVTNGTGTDGDENDAKSGAGRLVFLLSEDVRLGANLSLRDHPVGPDTDEHGAAWGVDLERGGFAEPGVHLQVGVIGGDNWMNGPPPAGPSTFLTGQGIVSYFTPVDDGPGPIDALEPLVRLSWADPDTGAEDDSGLLFTPGFVLHFGDRNKVATTVDVYSHEGGGTEWSLKLQSNLYF